MRMTEKRREGNKRKEKGTESMRQVWRRSDGRY